jgi:hypothetical protein
VKIDASDIADLRPIISAAVVAVMEELRQSELAQSSRLAYPEPEAAALLGVRPHCLRDARLRGEISASRVGKKTVYQRGELLRFLEQQKL